MPPEKKLLPRGLATHLLRGLLMAHAGDKMGIILTDLVRHSGLSKTSVKREVGMRSGLLHSQGDAILVEPGVKLSDFNGLGLRVLPKPGSGPKMEHWATKGRVTMGRKRK